MTRIEQIGDKEVTSIEEIKKIISNEIKNINNMNLKVLMLGKVEILAKEYQNLLKLEKYNYNLSFNQERRFYDSFN